MKTSHKPLTSIVLALLLFFTAQFIAGFTAVIVYHILHPDCHDVDPASITASEPRLLLYCMTAAYLVMVPMLFVLGLVRRNCAAAGPRRLPISRQVEALGLLLLLTWGCSCLGAVLQLPDDGTSALFTRFKDYPVSWPLLCLLGPLFEELIFRENLARQFHLWGLRPAFAAAISALSFGLIHLNLAQGVPAAILGFVLGLYYFRTGNIRLCLAAHVLNNSTAIVLLFFPEVEAAITGLPSVWLWVAAGGSFVVCGCGLYLRLFRGAGSLSLRVPPPPPVARD